MKEARETRNGVIKDFKLRLFAEFDQDRDVWLRSVRALAELDCLFSLAKSSSAIGEPACRPEFVESEDGAFIDFEELRHPALCLNAESFIPNDIKLGETVGRVALLTGKDQVTDALCRGLINRLFRAKHGVRSCLRCFNEVLKPDPNIQW